MMVGTIRIGIPQPRAPKISKIESTKLSDVFEQTSSVCLNGSKRGRGRRGRGRRGRGNR